MRSVIISFIFSLMLDKNRSWTLRHPVSPVSLGELTTSCVWTTRASESIRWLFKSVSRVKDIFLLKIINDSWSIVYETFHLNFQSGRFFKSCPNKTEQVWEWYFIIHFKVCLLFYCPRYFKTNMNGGECKRSLDKCSCCYLRLACPKKGYLFII